MSYRSTQRAIATLKERYKSYWSRHFFGERRKRYGRKYFYTCVEDYAEGEMDPKFFIKEIEEAIGLYLSIKGLEDGSLTVADVLISTLEAE